MTSYSKALAYIGICCVCVMMVNCAVYGGDWVKQTPSEDNELIVREDDDTDDDGHISWTATTQATGLRADCELVMLTHFETAIKQTVKNITCSRTEKYVWEACPGDDGIEGDTFNLTWSGNVEENLCTVFADNPGDFAHSYEYGYARVTSPEFDGADDKKWGALSKKGAECPQNPAAGKETNISVGGTISLSKDLTPEVTGDLAWNFVAHAGGERTVSGIESSQDTSGGASADVYVHPGGGTNSSVEATAHHSVTGRIKGKSGNGYLWPEDDDYDATAKAQAKTSLFTLSN